MKKDNPDALIPKHEGYRNLKNFQVAEFVYGLTVRFCEKPVDRFSRTRDQLVQAARSGREGLRMAGSAGILSPHA